MLAALVLGQALYAHPPAPPPPPAPPECQCAHVQAPPPAPYVPAAYEEVRLGSDFFVSEGGVGPRFTPPVYGGYVYDGGRDDGRFGSGPQGWSAVPFAARVNAIRGRR